MKVLWVDDQVNVAKTLAKVLPADYSVEFAESGSAALELLGKTSFDVVLADLRMPPGIWGGLWLLESIKHGLRAPPPVVVVSGEGAQSQTIEALRLGAADYVTKERLEFELAERLVALSQIVKAGRGTVDLLKQPEDQHLEFKSTLRWNLKADKADKAIELAALKSVAAFLNADGGTLLIGVADDGSPVGVEKDGFPDLDRFQLHFWNLIRQAIGADASSLVSTTCELIGDKTVFRVDCKPSNQPVFVTIKLEGRQEEIFFVRAGPQTEQLSTKQALAYVSEKFRVVGRGA